MCRKLLIVVFFLEAACAPRGERLIPEESLRQSVRTQLSVQEELAQNRRVLLFSVVNGDLTRAEREALEWLYAWMPLSDLADHDGEFYLRQVQATLQARVEMIWGRRIPADLFLHFVLPLRVNNENLDSARVVLFDMLRERVRGMTMRQAALEVNHWCHEHVTYRGADMRTSAPLATLRSAIGRCGEESVFTVAALRAIGLPARQVYTPRWAHSDDNHAWVEVWADGQWYFLGACEPEPELNMGWFREPARRAMLVHTRVWGPYAGPEELLAASPRHREINVLDRYAVTKTLVVKTVDVHGRPLPDADVSFRLYNYAEFYPLARRISDADGCCSFTTGLGDLLIWAHRDSLTGFAPAHTAAEDSVTITLQPFRSREACLDLDITPPLSRPAWPDTTAEAARALNSRRLAHEDSLRKAYEATFIDSLASLRFAKAADLAPDSVWTVLHKSRGNHAEIGRFITEGAGIDRTLVLPLLAHLSDKDLRDARAEVLLDYLKETPPVALADRALYHQYILNPRIRNEALVAWRPLLLEETSPAWQDSARANPLLLADWVRRSIRIDSTANYYSVPLTPRGVWQLRIADPLSRDIFLVALCRTLGVPARLDPAFERPQYYDPARGKWKNFGRDQADSGEPGYSLILRSNDKLITRPEYWSHFTLARFEGDEYKTLELEGLPFAKGEARLELPEGDYLLITGFRKPDGTVLSRLHFFPLKSGSAREVDLIWRRAAGVIQPLGVLPGGVSITLAGGEPRSLRQLAKPGGLILAWLDPGREPSQHVLREWQELRPLYEKWGGSLIALVQPEKAGRLQEYRLPAQLQLAQDGGEELLRQITAILPGVRPDEYPVILNADRSGKVLLFNQGYQVGLGDRVMQMIAQVKGL
jgi:transglutaminase-like putative cysteine protease